MRESETESVERYVRILQKNKEKYKVEWKTLEVRLWKMGSSLKGAQEPNLSCYKLHTETLNCITLKSIIKSQQTDYSQSSEHWYQIFSPNYQN